MSDRILRRREVQRLTGLSSSTIYDWMKADRFPSPVRLGARSVGWRESEIDEWIEDRRRQNYLADYFDIPI